MKRSIRHAATVAANWHHSWSRYALHVNLNGKLQSKTHYTSYEDAPGFGLWNLHTRHTFVLHRSSLVLEPTLGIDNLFNRVDRRIDSTNRKYALYYPGRMLVVGLQVRFKQ